ATTIDEATAIVDRLVRERDYCWANMLVATADGVAAIEVRDRQIIVDHHPRQVVRANHHICLGANAADDDTETTPVRYRLALRGIEAAQSLNDIFALTRTHADGLNWGICNHGGMETVYSYVVHW